MRRCPYCGSTMVWNLRYNAGYPCGYYKCNVCGYDELKDHNIRYDDHTEMKYSTITNHTIYNTDHG